MKIIETKAATLELIEPDLVFIKLKDNYTFKIEDIQDIVKAAGEIGGNKPLLNVIDVANFSEYDHKVRDYTASEEGNKFTIATAFIVSSTPMELLGNFYISFQKPSRPTKLFTSKQKAIDWLRGINK